MKNPVFYLTGLLLLVALQACNSSKKEGENTTATQQAEETATLPEGAISGGDEGGEGQRRIIFFGNSLSAGYGLDDPAKAFPGLIQQKIDSLGLGYMVVNAGVSGETTAGGRNRIDWVLKQPVDMLVLELGGNDGLRGIPAEESISNLQAIIDATLTKYPEARVVLAGMQAPPNMGQDYTQSFAAMYPRLAEENNLPLVPFLLEGVAGETSLNLPDGIHPTEEGHRIVAENVWAVLKPLLQKDV